MCCCCCCCFYSRVPGKTGSRNWLCVHCTAMTFSLLGIVIAGAIQIYIGGPIPTYAYESGSILYFISRTFTILSTIGCMVVIVRVITNRVIGLVVLVCIVISVITVIPCIALLAMPPGAESMSPYARDYYAKNKVPPPPLELLQDKINDFLKEGCCGGASFDDYAVSTKRWAFSDEDRGHYVFDAPDSCCKKEFEGKECGKNLIFFLHMIDYSIVDEALMKVKNENDFESMLDKILQQKIKEEREKLRTTNVSKNNASEYSEDEIKVAAKENLLMFNKYDKRRDNETKIHTVGCGKLLDGVRSGKISIVGAAMSMFDFVLPTLFGLIIGYVVLEMILGGAAIGIYVWYFYKYNTYKPIPVSPEYGEEGGALSENPALSEGDGQPKVNTDNSKLTVAAEGKVVTPPGSPPPSPSPPENS